MEPARQPSPPQPPQLPQLQVRSCGIHGIVVGPEGRCIICKRNMAEPVEEGSGRTTVAAVLLLAAVLGGALVFKGLSGKPPEPPPAFHTQVALASRPLLLPLDEDADTVAREQAKGEVAAARLLEKQRDLEEATHAVKVRVYMTETCDLCRTGTAYLKEQGLAYTELDVDKDPAALEALRKLHPDPMVPTFEVDGEVVVGFGPREMGAAVARAAQHRVR